VVDADSVHQRLMLIQTSYISGLTHIQPSKGDHRKAPLLRFTLQTLLKTENQTYAQPTEITPVVCKGKKIQEIQCEGSNSVFNPVL